MKSKKELKEHQVYYNLQTWNRRGTKLAKSELSVLTKFEKAHPRTARKLKKQAGFLASEIKEVK